VAPSANVVIRRMFVGGALCLSILLVVMQMFFKSAPQAVANVCQSY
jgi:hypothetical protein